MKKLAVKILFAFRNSSLLSYIPEVRQFVTTSASITELNVGTPPLPSTALAILDDIETKQAEIVRAQVKLNELKGERKGLYNNLSGILVKMQNNASNYIGEDEVKAATLEATIENFSTKRASAIPDKPVVKMVKDTKLSGFVQIMLTDKPLGSKTYQVRYTTNYGQANAETTVCTEVFLNMRQIIISGLPKGQEIAFEVRATNSNGHGPWSDVHFKLIN